MATLPRLRPDAASTTSSSRSRSSGRGRSSGRWCIPYLKRRQGVEPVDVSASVARADSEADARRAAVPGAAAAHGDGGGRLLRRRGRGAAARVRLQAIREADAAGRRQAARGHGAQGITGDAAEEIIRSITSFALYGFPESHAASFALLVYASAYLKAHYPAAFYTAMLNNQPMGFYHPATLVKDAQRHGVRFAPIDVQESDWECRVDADGRVRLGLMYVNGLRAGGRAGDRRLGSRLRRSRGRASDRTLTEHEPGWSAASTERRCPKCGCDDRVDARGRRRSDGSVLQHLRERMERTQCPPVPESPSDPERPGPQSQSQPQSPQSVRLDRRSDRAHRHPPRRAGDARGDRRAQRLRPRSAQRVVADRARDSPRGRVVPRLGSARTQSRVPSPESRDAVPSPESPVATRSAKSSPLRPMTPTERLLADYCRHEPDDRAAPAGAAAAWSWRCAACCARVDLPHGRHGRRVRVAGAVITRQRPGTAKGFVFLTLEDETGIANIIVRPDLFTEQRADHRRRSLPARRGHAAAAGRGDLGQGGARARADRGRPGTAVTRLSVERLQLSSADSPANQAGRLHILPGQDRQPGRMVDGVDLYRTCSTGRDHPSVSFIWAGRV